MGSTSFVGILKAHEAGVSVTDPCRKHGVSDASIYKRKAKFGGMEVSEAKRLKTLKDDTTRLKQLLAPLVSYGGSRFTQLQFNNWDHEPHAAKARRVIIARTLNMRGLSIAQGQHRHTVTR
jgi:putative transposase